MKAIAKIRTMGTVNSKRVEQAFDAAFQTVREEAVSAAAALGFNPDKGLSGALEFESRQYDGMKEKWYAQLPRATRARIRCAEIILHLLSLPESGANGLAEEITLTYREVDELRQQLSIATSRKLAA